MNTHNQINELLAGFALGELGAEQTYDVEKHLAECNLCRTELEKIEALLKSADEMKTKAADQQLCESAKITLFASIKEKNQESSFKQKSLWRTIMKSKITKIAAAAAIIIAVIFGLSHLGFDGTSIVLAQMLDMMEKQNWVYVTVDYNSPDKKGPEYFWTCFEPHIETRQTAEEISFTNYTEGVKYAYPTDTNTIIITSATDKYNIPGPKSPFEAIEAIIKSAKEQKANIKREKTRINNIPVEIITLTSKIQAATLVCDITQNLLISMNIEASGEGLKEKVSAYAVFKYPENGPKDIYSLSVPTSAAVVDNRPPGNVVALVNRIQELFNKGVEDHIAVVFQSWVDDNNNLKPGSIIVMRQKGNQKRTDRYHAYDASKRNDYQSLYEKIKDLWPNLTISQVLALENKTYLERKIIFDGKYTITGFQNRNGIIKNRKQTDLLKINYSDCFAGLIWPNIEVLMMGRPSEAKKIELLKEDSNHIGLVGFRVITSEKNKNQKYMQGTEPQPGTDDYWFDPDKNYMLVEHASKKEAGEFGGLSDSQTVVIQTAQTRSGIWYPALIRNKSMYLTPKGEKQNRNMEQRIILDTKPDFAENTFTENFLE